MSSVDPGGITGNNSVEFIIIVILQHFCIKSDRENGQSDMLFNQFAYSYTTFVSCG